MTKEEAVIQGLQGHIEALYETIEKQDKIIKALEQQPCDDCVSREDAMSMIVCYVNEIKAEVMDDIKASMIKLPPVTPTHQVGKWINEEDELLGCSICHKKIFTIDKFNYCPNCGAEMRGNENEENI